MFLDAIGGRQWREAHEVNAPALYVALLPLFAAWFSYSDRRVFVLPLFLFSESISMKKKGAVMPFPHYQLYLAANLSSEERSSHKSLLVKG